MPIQGSLDEVSLADVLQLLALGKKTGRLSLNDGAMQGHIYLDAGRISYAAVVDRRDRVGDVLVKAGRITQKQLDEAAEHQSHDGTKKLGEILVGSGRVARTELDRVVRAQVQEAVAFMFTWKRGSFTYQSRLRPEQADFLVSLNPGAILLEAARRVDEWSLLKKKIPSFDMVFQIDEARLTAANVTLTSEQKRIVPFLDGSRDVVAIVEATGLVEFDVAKALYGLVTAGFAWLVERRSVMRHLTYRGFLAYLVSEAEFADPTWRRKAQRHIGNCSLCTKRLKKIHRRTGEVAAVESDEADTRAEHRSVPVPQSPATAQAASAEARKRHATSEKSEESSRERRSGSDRRSDERRWGERRLAARPGLSATWPVEQRRGSDRRKGDRRKSDRRGSKTGVTGADTASRPAPDATPSELEGTAVTPLATTDGSPEAAVPPSERPTARFSLREIQDAAASAGDKAGTPEPSRPAGRASAQAPEVNAIGSPSSAKPPRGRRSSDIEWLVSPDDADEMLRQRRPKPPAASAQPPASIAPQVSPERAPSRAASAKHTRVTEPVATPDRPEKKTKWAKRTPATRPEPKPRRSTKEQKSAAETPPARPARKPEGPTKETKWALRTPATRPAPTPDRQESGSGTEVLGKDAAKPTARPPAQVGTDAAVTTTQVAAPLARPAPTDRATAEAEGAGGSRRPSWLVVAATFVVAAGLGWLTGVSMERGPAGTSETAAAAAVGSPGIPEPTRPAVVTDSGVGAPAVTVPPGDNSGTRALRGGPDAASAPVRSPPISAEPESGARPESGGSAPRRPAGESGSPGRRSEEAVAVRPPAASTPPAPVVVEAPVRSPVVATIRGVVRSAATGEPLAGARVSLRGAGLVTRTDALGAYELRDVPDGTVTIEAVLDGYLAESVDVLHDAGAAIELDVALRGPPRALEPDTGLAIGGWLAASRAEAADILGHPVAVIPGLWIESVATPAESSRPRVRVALLTASGERVVLVESQSGGFVRGGPARVTALRIMPPSEAFPITTGTASFGTLLVTAQTGLAADSLRVLLGRLIELPGATRSDAAP